MNRPTADSTFSPEEDGLVFARVVGEHQGPRGLHQRIERELVLTREGLHRGGVLLGQGHLALAALGGVAGGFTRERFRQGGGRRHPRERGTPEGLGLRGLLALEPRHVVPVAVRRSDGRERLTRGEPGVRREQLLEEQRDAPAVHQQVVEAPHQAPRVLSQLDEREPHQRRPGEVEAQGAVLGEERLEASLPLRLRMRAPVELLPGQFAPGLHPLERLLQALPEEARAQHRVSRQHVLPGAVQGDRVELGVEECPGQLLEVGAGARRQQRVEEQAALHGRQRIDVLQRGLVLEQGVQEVRGHAREREVRRGPHERLGRVPLGDERAQGLREALPHALEGGLQVEVLAVRERDLQPSPEDEGVDLQDVRARSLAALHGPGGEPGEAELGRGGQGRVELPQIVEQDRRPRRARPARRSSPRRRSSSAVR